MVKLTATKPTKYKGRIYQAGDPIEADAGKDVIALTRAFGAVPAEERRARGRPPGAARAASDFPESTSQVKPDDETAATAPTADAVKPLTSDDVPPSRRYSTRRLRAED